MLFLDLSTRYWLTLKEELQLPLVLKDKCPRPQCKLRKYKLRIIKILSVPLYVEVGDQAQIGNPTETARSFFRILQYGTVAILGAVLEDDTVKRVPVLIISWTYPAFVPSKIFVGFCVKTNVCAGMLYPFYSFVIKICYIYKYVSSHAILL